MSYNKKILLSLLVSYGVFANQTLAEEFVRKVSEKSARPLIALIQEKEDKVTKRELNVFEGKLGNRDHKLIDTLIKTKLYNDFNAELFVRSLSENEVEDLSKLINEESIKRASQALAATID